MKKTKIKNKKKNLLIMFNKNNKRIRNKILIKKIFLMKTRISAI
jgi:hypothetical protein